MNFSVSEPSNEHPGLISLRMDWLYLLAVQGTLKKVEATPKQAFTKSLGLKLPDPEKAFQLYVHEKEGIALGVLTQRLGSEPQPVAHLSKTLNPTT